MRSRWPNSVLVHTDQTGETTVFPDRDFWPGAIARPGKQCPWMVCSAAVAQ